MVALVRKGTYFFALNLSQLLHMVYCTVMYTTCIYNSIWSRAISILARIGHWGRFKCPGTSSRETTGEWQAFGLSSLGDAKLFYNFVQTLQDQSCWGYFQLQFLKSTFVEFRVSCSHNRAWWWHQICDVLHCRNHLWESEGVMEMLKKWCTERTQQATPSCV